MSDSARGNPIPAALVVIVLVGGGWYFFKNYEIDGLDGLAVYTKHDPDNEEFVTAFDRPTLTRLGQYGNDGFDRDRARNSSNPSSGSQRKNSAGRRTDDLSSPNRRNSRVNNLRVASWALDGLGSGNQADAASVELFARVLGEFDVVALQQISIKPRDLVPRLVDAINHHGRNYDFVVGGSVGPPDQQEKLAFVFDSQRVHVDRNQTYSVADPDNQLTFDPLVAWFRAAEPSAQLAWTFSLVNLRIELSRASDEVALLSRIMSAVRNDGRGEDDVVIAGLLQADDAYLLPKIMGDRVHAAVAGTKTDIFARHQTTNILVDIDSTNEYVGRGNVVDFLRVYNLDIDQAKSVSSQLPVFAEFSALETTDL